MARNVPELVFKVDSVEIVSWSPGRTGVDKYDCPATQVHILLNVQGLPVPLAYRMKTKEDADNLIAALTDHRDYVWGSPDGNQ